MHVRGRTFLCLSVSLAGASIPAVSALSQATVTATPSLKASTPKPPSKEEVALYEAADQGDAVRVQALLDRGAPASFQAPNGITPLIVASMMNHPSVVKLLLGHGADVNAALKPGGYVGGSTALIMAAEGSGNILAGAVTPAAPKGYEGHEAEFMEKHPDLVRMWEQQVNAWAKGFDQIVEMLVAHGADVNAQTTVGLTAIDGAANDSDLDVVRLLLEKGARLDLPTHHTDPTNGRSIDGTNGYEALTGATSMDQHSPEVIKLLLAHGAKPNAKSVDDLTPLGRAAQSGDAEVVRLLLDAGADVNAYDGFGRTALMLAKGNKHADVVALLDKAGAKDMPQGPHDEVTITELGQRPDGRKVMQKTETTTQVTVTRVVPKPAPKKQQGH